jgi:hypothetical protein
MKANPRHMYVADLYGSLASLIKLWDIPERIRLTNCYWCNVSLDNELKFKTRSFNTVDAAITFIKQAGGTVHRFKTPATMYEFLAEALS